MCVSGFNYWLYFENILHWHTKTQTNEVAWSKLNSMRCSIYYSTSVNTSFDNPMHLSLAPTPCMIRDRTYPFCSRNGSITKFTATQLDGSLPNVGSLDVFKKTNTKYHNSRSGVVRRQAVFVFAQNSTQTSARTVSLTKSAFVAVFAFTEVYVHNAAKSLQTNCGMRHMKKSLF